MRTSSAAFPLMLGTARSYKALRTAPRRPRTFVQTRVVLTEQPALPVSAQMATLDTTCDAPAERARLLAPAAALLTVTLWASALVGIRSAGHHLSPGALALGRLLVGS